jgi:hypothetical protein
MLDLRPFPADALVSRSASCAPRSARSWPISRTRPRRSFSSSTGWGGAHSELRLLKRRRGERNSTSFDIIQAVRQLALIASDDLIAGLLNRNGLKKGNGNRWTRERVTSMRSNFRPGQHGVRHELGAIVRDDHSGHLYPLPAGIVLVRLYIVNHKFLHRVAGLESSSQPARLFSTPRPGFGWLARISVFWKYARIFAPLPRRIFQLLIRRFRLRHLFFAMKLCQSPFERVFFRRQPHGQDLANFLVQLPHFVNRHGIKIQFLAHPQLSGVCDSTADYINVTSKLSSAKSTWINFAICAAPTKIKPNHLCLQGNL